MSWLRKHILECVFVFLALTCAVVACAPIQDSVFSDQLLNTNREMNLQAITRIGNIEADGKIRIAVLADAHQNYSSLDKVVYEINAVSGIDFVVNVGDFTNSGYNLEYDQYIDSIIELRKPTLTVIGNHDSIGAGPALFQKAFSPPNYYFESSSMRFIFFNSANLENPGQFDAQWLKDTVFASTKPIFIFTHCSLRDPERFTGATAQIFTDVITHPLVQMVVNGHNHVYSLTSESSTTLLQVERVEGSSWVLLEVQGNQLTIEDKGSGTKEVVTLK